MYCFELEQRIRVIIPLLPTSSTTRSFLSDDSVGKDSGAAVGFSPDESDSEVKNLSLGGTGAAIGERKGTLAEQLWWVIRGEMRSLRAQRDAFRKRAPLMADLRFRVLGRRVCKSLDKSGWSLNESVTGPFCPLLQSKNPELNQLYGVAKHTWKSENSCLHSSQVAKLNSVVWRTFAYCTFVIHIRSVANNVFVISSWSRKCT